MGLRMKKKIYFGDSQKNLMLKERPQKNLQGGLPKKRGLGQFVDLRTAWQKRGVVFKGVYTPMHTMFYTRFYWK